MGIQEEIFEKFFWKLKEEKNFPIKKVEELKNLLGNENIELKEKIIQLVERGWRNEVKIPILWL